MTRSLQIYDTSRSREAVCTLNIHDMGTLPDINKKEKVRTPYWEAFTLDRTWQPPPHHKTTTKSTFGAQILSERQTSPSFGFGTAGRQAYTKMFLSTEMAKTKPGNFSPGPAYKVGSSFGKQSESLWESPPECKIGTGSRWRRKKPPDQPGPGAYETAGSSFGYQVQSERKSPEKYVFSKGTRVQADKIFLSQEFNKVKLGTQSPGPMTYGARTTFGKQSASKDRTAPVINFTRGKRVLRTFDGASTGPGEYPIVGSVGLQPESQKLTLPSFSFPHCSRDRYDKVFLSKEHDRAYLGRTSPGPAGFKQVSSMGNQPLSKCVNPPFIKFTKGLRWNCPPDDMPGPGTYDV